VGFFFARFVFVDERDRVAVAVCLPREASFVFEEQLCLVRQRVGVFAAFFGQGRLDERARRGVCAGAFFQEADGTPVVLVDDRDARPELQVSAVGACPAVPEVAWCLPGVGLAVGQLRVVVAGQFEAGTAPRRLRGQFQLGSCSLSRS
jgi:hypothetical protein